LIEVECVWCERKIQNTVSQGAYCYDCGMGAQVVDIDTATLAEMSARLGQVFGADRRGGVYPFFWSQGITANSLDALVLLYEKVTVDIGRLTVSPELTDKLEAYVEAGIVTSIRTGHDQWAGFVEDFPFQAITTDYLRREVEIERANIRLPNVIEMLAQFQLTLAQRTGLKAPAVQRAMAEMRRHDRKEGSRWAVNPVGVINKTAEAGLWGGLHGAYPLTNRVLRYAWPDVLSGSTIEPLDKLDRVAGALGEWIGDIKEGMPRYEKPDSILKIRDEGGEEGFLDTILSSVRDGDEFGDEQLSQRLSRMLDRRISLARRVEKPSFDAAGVTVTAAVTAVGLLVGGPPGGAIGGMTGAVSSAWLKALAKGRVEKWTRFFL
jgi:hypothetical protein